MSVLEYFLHKRESFSAHLAWGALLGLVAAHRSGDALLAKLERFWAYKLVSGESVAADAPVLCNQAGHRVSKRRLQTTFKHWQRVAVRTGEAVAKRSFVETRTPESLPSYLATERASSRAAIAPSIPASVNLSAFSGLRTHCLTISS